MSSGKSSGRPTKYSISKVLEKVGLSVSDIKSSSNAGQSGKEADNSGQETGAESSPVQEPTAEVDVKKVDVKKYDFKPGDTVRVHARIVEGNKERIQIFEGVVIKRHKRNQRSATFTVRKISYSVGVERTFLLHSPRIERIEIVTRGVVRRARLFYLRDTVGKAGRIKVDRTGEQDGPPQDEQEDEQTGSSKSGNGSGGNDPGSKGKSGRKSQADGETQSAAA